MLAAYPWQVRPNDEPLTGDEVCEALWAAEGDIRIAADRLKVGSLVLRKFIDRSPRARAVIGEANDCLTDEAGTILRQAMRDSDARRQDWAIRYVLNSKNARGKGWSPTDDASAALEHPRTTVVVQPIVWADGTKIGPRASPSSGPLIEVAPAVKAKEDSS